MKVRDLQAILATQNPEMEVVIKDARWTCLAPINTMQVERAMHRATDDLYDHINTPPENRTSTVLLLRHSDEIPAFQEED